MATSEPKELVVDLLRLRRWALAALSSHPEIAHDLRDVSQETWRLFLGLERCAAVALDRLSEAGAVDTLPATALDVLRAVAAEETQSALQARGDGREIASIARSAGYPVAALKGGVRALAGAAPPLPVADVDLLVKREQVKNLVGRLKAASFGEPSRELGHHQAVTSLGQRLAVEVHWTTHDDGRPLDAGVWDRMRPIDTLSPLLQLGKTDNLMHLIEHAVLIHRERSISLRDTVLIGMCARECENEELAALRRAIGGNQAMLSLLHFAIALDWQQETPDPFVESCATYYSALAVAGQMDILQKSLGALAFVTETELARIPRTESMRNTLRWRGTGNEGLARIANSVPGFGSFVLAPAHLAYYSVVSAVAGPAIRRTRRQALDLLAQRNR